jgi:hypothetical protein
MFGAHSLYPGAEAGKKEPTFIGREARLQLPYEAGQIVSRPGG